MDWNPMDNRSDEHAVAAAQREWNAILSAKGYGNKWSNWILAFEVVAYLPTTVPEMDIIDTVTQITEHDCNCACLEESRCRRNKFQATIQFDQEHDFSKLSYRIIKSKKRHNLPMCRFTERLRLNCLDRLWALRHFS